MIEQARTKLAEVTTELVTYLQKQPIEELTVKELLEGTSQEAHDFGLLLMDIVILKYVIEDLEGIES